MLDTQIDLVALQVCLLEQLFDEAERTWAVENEKKNERENKCAECEHCNPAASAEREPSKNPPARHWPAHRRFWHRSPRKWREEIVKSES